MSLAIVSGGERALIMGDVAIHPAQVTEPDWSAIFDMDQQLAAQIGGGSSTRSRRRQPPWWLATSPLQGSGASCAWRDAAIGKDYRAIG